MTTNAKTTQAVENGAEIFVPLSKLKKSPRNARRMGHSAASIEALAASIAAKGMLQNLVVEPELNSECAQTGFYFVTIGEGRRLAQLARVKRKEIRKNEPIRCVLDISNDPHEISLDENVTREAMHPADQFEAFRKLAEDQGWGAEEIAARFGVKAHVVRQRLRLGAVSQKLMTVYREGGLTLDQLMAFAITDDHARQEQVFEMLSYNREPFQIRRELTKTNVVATDRRAIFIGPEAYTEAGGTILRDLFTEDHGGFYEDVALLDRLVMGKLERIAGQVQETEGWKWTSVHIDYPHSHGMRRAYPSPVELSAEDEAAHDATHAEYEARSAQYEGAEELPADIDQRFHELEGEIERIDAQRHAFDPDDIVRGGVIVALSHDGTARIERGFVRPEDERPATNESAEGEGEHIADAEGVGSSEGGDGIDGSEHDSEEEADDGKPLSDLMNRDLTAYRTLGLRVALSEQPEMALVALTHTLAAQIFYRMTEAHCLDIRPTSLPLAGYADGIEDSAAAKLLADRHAVWAADLPREATNLWAFLVSLDQTRLIALLTYCSALTVSAVKQPWERKPLAEETVDQLATATRLDMTSYWTPTAHSYFSRVTKALIVAAVREAIGEETAERIAVMKKQAMAEAAEQLCVGSGWLPAIMRTPVLAVRREPDRKTGHEAALQDAEGFHEAAE